MSEYTDLMHASSPDGWWRCNDASGDLQSEISGPALSVTGPATYQVNFGRSIEYGISVSQPESIYVPASLQEEFTIQFWFRPFEMNGDIVRFHTPGGDDIAFGMYRDTVAAGTSILSMRRDSTIFTSSIVNGWSLPGQTDLITLYMSNESVGLIYLSRSGWFVKNYGIGPFALTDEIDGFSFGGLSGTLTEISYYNHRKPFADAGEVFLAGTKEGEHSYLFAEPVQREAFDPAWATQSGLVLAELDSDFGMAAYHGKPSPVKVSMRSIGDVVGEYTIVEMLYQEETISSSASLSGTPTYTGAEEFEVDNRLAPHSEPATLTPGNFRGGVGGVGWRPNAAKIMFVACDYPGRFGANLDTITPYLTSPQGRKVPTIRFASIEFGESDPGHYIWMDTGIGPHDGHCFIYSDRTFDIAFENISDPRMDDYQARDIWRRSLMKAIHTGEEPWPFSIYDTEDLFTGSEDRPSQWWALEADYSAAKGTVDIQTVIKAANNLGVKIVGVTRRDPGNGYTEGDLSNYNLNLFNLDPIYMAAWSMVTDTVKSDGRTHGIQGGSPASDYLDTILDLAGNNQEIDIVYTNDDTGSFGPSFARTIFNALREAADILYQMGRSVNICHAGFSDYGLKRQPGMLAGRRDPSWYESLYDIPHYIKTPMMPFDPKDPKVNLMWDRAVEFFHGGNGNDGPETQQETIWQLVSGRGLDADGRGRKWGATGSVFGYFGDVVHYPQGPPSSGSLVIKVIYDDPRDPFKYRTEHSKYDPLVDGGLISAWYEELVDLFLPSHTFDGTAKWLSVRGGPHPRVPSDWEPSQWPEMHFPPTGVTYYSTGWGHENGAWWGSVTDPFGTRVSDVWGIDALDPRAHSIAQRDVTVFGRPN